MEPTVYLRLRRWIAALPIAEKGRRERYAWFVRACHLNPGEPILDVGCGASITLARFNERRNPIVGVDVSEENRPALQAYGVKLIIGDVRELPFSDKTFPVVFCNSLIEHVLEDDRERAAGEIRRVGERYWVQTPNKHFPVEPHYMLPFVQYLPRRVRLRMEQRFNRGEPIRLLRKDEVRRLFPDAQILYERRFLLTKSLIACRA